VEGGLDQYKLNALTDSFCHNQQNVGLKELKELKRSSTVNAFITFIIVTFTIHHFFALPLQDANLSCQKYTVQIPSIGLTSRTLTFSDFLRSKVFVLAN